MHIRTCSFLMLLLLFLGCKNNKTPVSELDYTTHYHKAIKKVTDVIVHDIFSPPVASRIYAYITIAGYETVRLSDPKSFSFSEKISHLKPLDISGVEKTTDFKTASLFAILFAGKNFIFSEDSISVAIEALKSDLKNLGMTNAEIKTAESLGINISKQIVDWSKKDNYLQTRSFPKFQVTNETTRWRPTPPGYMDAIEPSWNKIRPMFLDSASAFKPEPPHTYDIKNKKSPFFLEAVEVYETGKNLTKEQIAIAQFWDCNPFKLNVVGHVMFAEKKISPGGHWVNIVSLASKKSNFDMMKTAQTYAVLSIGLFDAFISCWDEKYRSNLIRPESVINDQIDKNWIPLIQTPPFPEHTSGHSVASSASAVILTHIFGENYSFDDDTEIEFGLPVRSFTSFDHAAQEASISRLYGGIHYRRAIDQGVLQGAKVGKNVISKVFNK
jgi:hypothetical protein